MKFLGIVVGLACMVGLAVWGLVYLMTSNEGLASTLGSFPVALSLHSFDTLEQKYARLSLGPHRRTAIYTYRGFAIRWPIMLIAAIPLLVTSRSLSNGLAQVILSMEGIGGAQQITAGILTLSLPCQFAGAFLIGRWIAIRSAGYGLAVLLVSCLIAAAAARATDFVSTPYDITEDVFREFIPRMWFLMGFTPALGIFLTGGLIGYWRGRRLRMATYLQYLLGALPGESRDAIVNLAYEEAERAGGKMQPHPSA